MSRLTAWALIALVSAVQLGCSKERVARARITGYLFDGETGQAMEGVNIKTFEAGNEVKATTKGGFFNLEGLSASGQYRVTAAKDGYATRFFNVTIAQVPTDAYDAVPLASVGSVAMAAVKGTVKGRVEFLNASSAPLPIANATVIMDLVNNGSFDLVKTVATSATGEFSIDGLPSLPTGLNLSICVISQADARYAAVEFAPLCTNINVYSGQANFITLRPSRTDSNVGDVNFYQGTVRDAITRLPIQGVSVYEVGKDSEAVTTDSNGYYFLRTTSVNKYAQVVFKKENYAEGLQEYNVLGRGGTQNRDLNLAPGNASIVGRIMYANSQPANSAEIRLDMRSAGYNVFKLVKTNATGDFTIDNLPGLPTV